MSDPTRDAPASVPAPTLSDVAALAGVSRAIASRALSAQPRPVSADKRERVLRAIRLPRRRRRTGSVPG
ncbi:MAG: LacI family transcriptional regulator, partial [Oxalobacteraceae bacterium]